MSKKKVETDKINIGGLGDMIAKLTNILGIQPCNACNKRKDWLNQVFPRMVAIEMTEEELDRYGKLKNARVLTNADALFIETLYFKSFSIPKTKGLCRSCPAIWRDVMQKLDKIYNIQINIKEDGEETV